MDTASFSIEIVEMLSDRKTASPFLITKPRHLSNCAFVIDGKETNAFGRNSWPRPWNDLPDATKSPVVHVTWCQFFMMASLIKTAPSHSDPRKYEVSKHPQRTVEGRRLEPQRRTTDLLVRALEHGVEEGGREVEGDRVAGRRSVG